MAEQEQTVRRNVVSRIGSVSRKGAGWLWARKKPITWTMYYGSCAFIGGILASVIAIRGASTNLFRIDDQSK